MTLGRRVFGRDVREAGLSGVLCGGCLCLRPSWGCGWGAKGTSGNDRGGVNILRIDGLSNWVWAGAVALLEMKCAKSLRALRNSAVSQSEVNELREGSRDASLPCSARSRSARRSDNLCPCGGAEKTERQALQGSVRVGKL
jgi:hypothetical protein